MKKFLSKLLKNPAIRAVAVKIALNVISSIVSKKPRRK